jgi:hypothetical protein
MPVGEQPAEGDVIVRADNRWTAAAPQAQLTEIDGGTP